MARLVPKLSASLIIVDRSGSEPRFLFGRRHASHVFMPNRYVFPGGRVDLADKRVATPLALHGQDKAVIDNHLSKRQRAKGADAVGLCAIREAWEESGQLIAKPAQFTAPHAHWQAFSDHEVAPDLSSLRLLARAVTPTYYPRRYDVWFFLVFRDAIALSVDVCGPDSELDHQIWASEEETLSFDLPSITRMVLREAMVRLDADPDLTGDAPVPMFVTRGTVTSRKILNT